ncbi:hypothetical protein BIZ10_002135 [Escherichia coli]|nr:hypothetical protein [Escherichia coli]EIH6259697.1 hypothetical protein [Escherichia coli]
MKNNALLLMTMIVVYLLFLVISINTPMHSDDYWYSLIGMDPSKHFAHYMGWSGRVVADYTSTILLSVKDHHVRASINSIAATLLIYNISMLPRSISFDLSKNKVAITSIFIFLLYWISNPALGQTAFWIVGSANYLWTSLIVIFFLRMTLKSKNEQSKSALKYIILFITGVFAGCSNENTSVTLIVLTSAIIIYYRVIDGRFDKLILTSFVGAISGCAILILAPGNFVRASGSSLGAWRESSLASKIFTHITKTMPDAIAQNWIALMFLVVILCLTLLSSKPAKNVSMLTIMFIGAFLCAHMAMALSPVYPPRAMHGPFIFLLCAISLSVELIKKPYFNYVIASLILPCVIFFIPSYAAMYISYSKTVKQNNIRKAIINNAIYNGKEDAVVPRFYFRGLIKDGDMFDVYHSPDMGRYYGIKKTTPEIIPFDYSIISEGCKTSIDAVIYNSKSNCIYAYMDKFKGETVFIMEFDKPFYYYEGSTKWISIQGTKNGVDFFKLPSMRTKSFKIGDKYYVYSKIKKSKALDIKRFRVSELDSSTGSLGNFYTSE